VESFILFDEVDRPDQKQAESNLRAQQITSVLFVNSAASEITNRLQLFLRGNHTSLLALSLIGYNAPQLPGELSP